MRLWLGSCVAGGCSSHLTPSLGTSICRRCSPKKTGKKKKGFLVENKVQRSVCLLIEIKWGLSLSNAGSKLEVMEEDHEICKLIFGKWADTLIYMVSDLACANHLYGNPYIDGCLSIPSISLHPPMPASLIFLPPVPELHAMPKL